MKEIKMPRSKIGVSGAVITILVAIVVAIFTAIIFIIVNKDNLANVWRPHNVVILVIIAVIIPISCVCAPIAGAIQAACCWRPVDEKYNPGLSKSQRARRGAKYALACAGVCIGCLVTCGEGTHSEPKYPTEENLEKPTSQPSAVLGGVHVV